MVTEGSPDPPENIHDNLTPPVTSVEIQGDTSDSEWEEGVLEIYEGYMPLPLAPNDERDAIIPYDNSVMDSDTSDEEDNVDEDQDNTVTPQIMESASSCSVSSIETVGREVCRELWAGKFEATNIEMNSEKAQEVISAMANFKLPPSSIPEWAKNLSEEDWKHEVVGRINRMQSETPDI